VIKYQLEKIDILPSLFTEEDIELKQFIFDLLIDIQTKDDALIWFEKFQEKSKTTMRITRGQVITGRAVLKTSDPRRSGSKRSLSIRFLTTHNRDDTCYKRHEKKIGSIYYEYREKSTILFSIYQTRAVPDTSDPRRSRSRKLPRIVMINRSNFYSVTFVTCVITIKRC
jgi:hypothetical protein